MGKGTCDQANMSHHHDSIAHIQAQDRGYLASTHGSNVQQTLMRPVDTLILTKLCSEEDSRHVGNSSTLHIHPR